MRSNYTLQFAEGTGSSPTSSAGTASAGDLKYIFPLASDQRHTLFGQINYAFKGGNKYTGPVIQDFKVFENTNFNLTANAFSGSPYTRKFIPRPLGGTQTVGGINMARLPWSYRLDFKVARTFFLGEDGKSRPLNVYVRVQNLLNTKNILAVNPATGSPETDGYLTNENSQGYF